MKITITDEDIKATQELMFPGVEAFDDERRTFLRCLNSVDVQACPGSGKTTLLVAKLLVLAGKYPLPNGAGICVLTHTNTAIEEIKKRFGRQSDILFRYPNFAGTIQSFVDKFLAIPYFTNFYGYRPTAIDDMRFGYEVNRCHGVNINRLKAYLANKKGLTLETLRFSFEQGCISQSLMDEKPFVAEKSDSYQQARQRKLAVLKAGYLCFDDAYVLANSYLKKQPQLVDLFCSRFAFVFIDEMQDTDIHQLRILERIFPRDKTIVQYIGDQNQAIYSSQVREDSVWTAGESSLDIAGTKRLSKEIADVVKQVALYPQPLVGITRETCIKPKLLVFDDNAIHLVIPTFCNLIAEYGLHQDAAIPNPVFKVIGWVGKPNAPKHTLVSYSPSFVQQHRDRLQPSCYDDYLALATQSHQDANTYRTIIVEAVVGFLRCVQITHSNGAMFTKDTLMKALEADHPAVLTLLRESLCSWVMLLHKKQDIKPDIQSFVLDQLVPCIQHHTQPDPAKVAEFFSKKQPIESLSASPMAYQHPQVKYEVATIHAVKGQTHTGTLYVETFYYNYDFEKLLPLFYVNSSEPTANKCRTQSRTIQAMKMAYVGMSRPTHLLCVAIHKTIGSDKRPSSRDLPQLQEQLGDTWDVIPIVCHP